MLCHPSAGDGVAAIYLFARLASSFRRVTRKDRRASCLFGGHPVRCPMPTPNINLHPKETSSARCICVCLKGQNNQCELRVFPRLQNSPRASFNLVEVQCRGGHQQHDAKRDDAVGQVQHWDLSGWPSPGQFGFSK